MGSQGWTNEQSEFQSRWLVNQQKKKWTTRNLYRSPELQTYQDTKYLSACYCSLIKRKLCTEKSIL